MVVMILLQRRQFFLWNENLIPCDSPRSFKRVDPFQFKDKIFFVRTERFDLELFPTPFFLEKNPRKKKVLNKAQHKA
jgi:hypothetical protein